MTQTQSARCQGFTLWFTGMSGAGKSTLTAALTAMLRAKHDKVEVLDGDEVRTHLSKGLNFSKEDRDINIDRIGYVARLLARNGVIVLTAAISPYAAARDAVRAAHQGDEVPFIEVYAEADLSALAARDPKGLYKKALAGEIAHFTGLSDPYEPPLRPEIIVRTDQETAEQSTARIWTYLVQQGFISS
jgi:adenylyl-sulfate kinase